MLHLKEKFKGNKTGLLTMKESLQGYFFVSAWRYFEEFLDGRKNTINQAKAPRINERKRRKLERVRQLYFGFNIPYKIFHKGLVERHMLTEQSPCNMAHLGKHSLYLYDRILHINSQLTISPDQLKEEREMIDMLIKQPVVSNDKQSHQESIKQHNVLSPQSAQTQKIIKFYSKAKSNFFPTDSIKARFKYAVETLKICQWDVDLAIKYHNLEVIHEDIERIYKFSEP